MLPMDYTSFVKLAFCTKTLTSLASNNVHICIFPMAILSGQVHFKYGNIRYFSSPKTRTVWHEIVILNIKGYPRKPLTNEDEANQENSISFCTFPNWSLATVM